MAYTDTVSNTEIKPYCTICKTNGHLARHHKDMPELFKGDLKMDEKRESTWRTPTDIEDRITKEELLVSLDVQDLIISDLLVKIDITKTCVESLGKLALIRNYINDIRDIEKDNEFSEAIDAITLIINPDSNLKR